MSGGKLYEELIKEYERSIKRCRSCKRLKSDSNESYFCWRNNRKSPVKTSGECYSYEKAVE